MIDKPPDAASSNLINAVVAALGAALMALATWLLKLAKTSQRPDGLEAESHSKEIEEEDKNKFSVLEYTRFRREMRAITREEVDKLMQRLDEINNTLSENREDVSHLKGRVQMLSESVNRHRGSIQEMNERLNARQA